MEAHRAYAPGMDAGLRLHLDRRHHGRTPGTMGYGRFRGRKERHRQPLQIPRHRLAGPGRHHFRPVPFRQLGPWAYLPPLAVRHAPPHREQLAPLSQKHPALYPQHGPGRRADGLPILSGAARRQSHSAQPPDGEPGARPEPDDLPGPQHPAENPPDPAPDLRIPDQSKQQGQLGLPTGAYGRSLRRFRRLHGRLRPPALRRRLADALPRRRSHAQFRPRPTQALGRAVPAIQNRAPVRLAPELYALLLRQTRLPQG